MSTFTVITPTADIRETPDVDVAKGKLETQLVFGESFVVESTKDGWCTGHCAHDGYKGWVEQSHLGKSPAHTHIVTAARSHVYKEPTMKSPHLRTLGFGSLVAVTEQDENYATLADGGRIYLKHLDAAGTVDEDYLGTARKFLETPYYWGGRSGFGIDCSGLVQVVLARAGIKAERDTEKQVSIGTEAKRTRTGDLVFFPGHVGIMADEDNLLHANAHHMKVTLEPLWQVEARSKGITAVRRI